MSILINGMEMPEMPESIEQGEAVPFADVRIFADGTAVISKGERPYFTQYTAVPVPPHGRSIDADALKSMWDDEIARLLERGIEYLDYHVNTLFSDFKHDVDKMPTIIPADPAEEGE